MRFAAAVRSGIAMLTQSHVEYSSEIVSLVTSVRPVIQSPVTGATELLERNRNARDNRMEMFDNVAKLIIPELYL